METFELGTFTEKTAALLHDAQESFKHYDLPMDDLPVLHTSDDEAIKLVFVGQYSAGKSSIIKMLTGIDTGIGAAIKTQESHTYEWNGIDIIDTPGIQTGVHPDHDEITYNEIDHAALLIFVITNEGFDQTIGEHFRKLAIEGKRGANMILVINKMDRAVQGNSPEQQEIMRPDIERVIAPFTLDQLYTSFVSTDRYEEALAEEEDEEFRQELLEESGYETFIAHLNNFVQEKHVSARLQKPLYGLAAAIGSIVGTKEEEHAIEGAEELAKRKLRIASEGRERCESMLQDIALTCQSDINAIGRRASLSIQSGVDEATVQQALSNASEEVKQRIQRCTQEMNQAYQNIFAGVVKEFDEQLDTPFAKKVIQELQESHIEFAGESEMQPRPSSAVVETPLGDIDLHDGVKTSQQIGKGILDHAVKSKSALAGKLSKSTPLTGFSDVLGSSLKGFSGSDIHSVVKGAGHFFDVKFAPWEALKITKGIAIFGKVLGAVGAIYSLYSALTAGDKAAEAEQKIRAAREDVRKKFEDGANQIYSELIGAMHTRLAEQLDPMIDELKSNVQVFEDRKATIAAYSTELQDLNERTQQLLTEIQSAADDGKTA